MNNIMGTEAEILPDDTERGWEQLDARAIVWLFSIEIETQLADLLGYNPLENEKETLFTKDPGEVMDALYEVADEIYTRHLGEMRYQLQREEVAQGLIELLGDKMDEANMVSVTSSRGRQFVNKWIAKAAVGKQEKEQDERARKKRMRKVDKNRRKKLMRWSAEVNRKLRKQYSQDKERVRVRACSEQTKRELRTFLDEHINQYHHNTSHMRSKYWLRALGAFLWKENIRLRDQVAFHEATRTIKEYRQVENEMIQHGKKLILDRRKSYKVLAYPPGYKHLSPRQLTEREHKLNKKYAHPEKIVPYCFKMYCYVRHIMEHGNEKKSAWRDIEEKLHDDFEKAGPQEQGRQLTLHDQYIHFPAPPYEEKEHTISYPEAVGYLFDEESQLSVIEREALYQLFHRYNYYYRYIKPKPDKIHPQLIREYFQRKQREYQERHGKDAETLVNLYTKELYAPEELIETITHRIGR